MNAASLPGFSYDARAKVARFYPYVPGKKGRERRMRTVSAETIDDAVAKWLEFRKELASIGTERQTLRTFLERFAARIAARKKPTTQRTHGNIIARWLLPQFGDTPLEEITSAAVNDFVAELQLKRLSAAYPSFTTSSFVKLFSPAKTA